MAPHGSGSGFSGPVPKQIFSVSSASLMLAPTAAVASVPGVDRHEPNGTFYAHSDAWCV